MLNETELQHQVGENESYSEAFDLIVGQLTSLDKELEADEDSESNVISSLVSELKMSVNMSSKTEFLTTKLSEALAAVADIGPQQEGSISMITLILVLNFRSKMHRWIPILGILLLI